MRNLSTAVLRIYDFRLLLFARMLSVMALQSQAVIVGWQVYSITKSPFLLGLVGLAEAVPALLCALVSGHIVDISRPHRVFMFCILGLVVNTAMLLLIGGGYAQPPLGLDVVHWIFIGVFLSGIGRSFIMPASMSLINKAVPRHELPSATAWMSSAATSMCIMGPAVAGIIYAGYDARGAWLLPATLMTLSFLLVTCMRDTVHMRNSDHREPVLQSIRAGWSFLLSHPVLLSAMSLDMLAVLFGGVTAMLPAVADQILHTGAEGLGALRASHAVGSVIISLYLALNPLRHIHVTHLLWTVAGFGACIIGFGFSTTFWISMLFLVLSGAFDCVSMVMRLTLVQLLTPDHMRGRIASVNSMFIISSNEIGAFESGLAARLLGLVPSIFFGGFMTLFVTGTIALFSPKFRRTVVDTRKA